MKPSVAVSQMPRSGIREIYDLALGIPDAIHLEVGEPDFRTAPHICDAAAAAAAAGFTTYTPNAGIPELREAITVKLRERNGVSVSPDQVVVTVGGGGALFTTLAALTDPGDEILLTDPGWPNYRMMSVMQSLIPVYYPLDETDGLMPSPEAIEPFLTERSKVLLINSPGNPTGAVIDRARMEALLDFASRHDLWVISDEVYDEIVFEEPAVSAAALDDEDRVVSIFSFSKTYAMTGWRMGYVAAPRDVAKIITKCQEPVTSCVNAPTQKAGVAALTGPQDVVAEMRDAYRVRRNKALALLEQAGVPAFRPGGAFYLWIDVSASGKSDMDFARSLVLEREVAVVPGTTFGPSSRSHVRVSVATAEDLLLEGLKRLAEAVNSPA